MERSSIIASVVAAGGILIAGSVASAAVINASASVEPEGMSHTIVAEPASPVFEPVADVNTTPEMTGSAPALTEVVAEELPIVTVPDVTGAAAPAPPAAASTPKPAKPAKAAKTTTAPQQPASAPASSSAAAPQVRTIPVETAVSMVLRATDGGVVQSTVQTTRAGYDAWAVTVLRHDGSIVTGFVDQVDGVVFDWVTVKQAPAPTPVAASTYSDDDDHEDDDHEDDDHDDDHGDDDDD